MMEIPKTPEKKADFFTALREADVATQQDLWHKAFLSLKPDDIASLMSDLKDEQLLNVAIDGACFVGYGKAAPFLTNERKTDIVTAVTQLGTKYAVIATNLVDVMTNRRMHVDIAAATKLHESQTREVIADLLALPLDEDDERKEQLRRDAVHMQKSKSALARYVGNLRIEKLRELDNALSRKGFAIKNLELLSDTRENKAAVAFFLDAKDDEKDACKQELWNLLAA